MTSLSEILALVDEGLGNSSYLVALGDGRALVVDPPRDPIQHLAYAERLGLRISHTVETHLHADFVTGSRELAERGAGVLAPAAAGLEWPHRGLGDGDEIDLGGLRLRALATPGHTPEHLAYLLVDGHRPLALFSGGSLLVGAVARTDLSGDDRTEELARALWRSLHERVLTLPDDLPVYPTHGSGSFCSSPAGADRATTIGREKASNRLLGADGEDAFVRLLLDSLGTYPRYFLRLPELNRTGPRVYGPQPPSLKPLSAEEVKRLLGEGVWLIDARPIASFGREHIPGAVSIQLRDDFATWLGWLVPDDVPLVFLLDPDQNRVDLVRQALKIGYEHLAGQLAGGMSAWRTAGFPTASVPFVRSDGVRGPEVVDIRQTSEFVEGHIPGSRHIELGSLTNGEPGPLPSGLVLTCGHGERAMSGATLLKRAGRSNVAVLEGGTSAWARAGRPVEAG